MADLGDVVAANVRGWRARHQWRQLDLAERTGWSKDTISDIETGRRRIGIADMPVLCESLEVTLAQLLDGAEPADLRRLGIA